MIIGQFIEKFFQSIPLTLLEFWGSFAFIVGLIIMLFSFSGFTFRTGTNWCLGREWQSWDEKTFISMGITFILIWITGYIGSFIVLVPGAQTFESLKDLTVFICIVLFGYPALLVVPFAYGLSDFYEGIPLDFMADWWVGYFINPACFWIALQFIGKCPDFRKLKTWGLYGLFVFFFLMIEPVLWGYICSGKFTTQESYYVITPALFFTTFVTWCFAPFVMLVVYPLVRRAGYFWAEIPGHVKQKRWRGDKWLWESGSPEYIDEECRTDSDAGVPIRLFILAPFIVTTILIMGTTFYCTLKNTERGTHKTAILFHEAIAEKINLRLKKTEPGAKLDSLLVDDMASAFIVDQSGMVIASSPGKFKEQVVAQSVDLLKTKYRMQIETGNYRLRFQVHINSPKNLTKETWLLQALPASGLDKNILLTAVPENFYLAGVRRAQSESALVFAAGLVLVLMVVGVLGAYVIHPLRRICYAAHALSEGDLGQRLPASKLAEMNTLAISFNTMATKLQEKEKRINLAVESGDLGIWEWDIKSGTVLWNDIMYRQYGMEPQKPMSFLEWSMLIVPEDFERVSHEIQAALRGERKYNVEYRVRRNDGSIHILNAHSNTLRDENGEPMKMIGVSYDVTESRNAEKELRLYRSQLEEVVEKRTKELTIKSEELAKAEVYQKIAQIFLSMRDYTNSPLQAQYFSIGLLKKRCSGESDIIESLEASVKKLSSINRILSRLESNFATDRLLSEKEILDYLDKMEHKS